MHLFVCIYKSVYMSIHIDWIDRYIKVYLSNRQICIIYFICVHMKVRIYEHINIHWVGVFTILTNRPYDFYTQGCFIVIRRSGSEIDENRK